MQYTTVIYSREGHIARITLNRPDAGNALNGQMARELEDICAHISGDDDIYVVTLTGAGDAFCRGAGDDSTGFRPAEAVAGIDRPVIAAVNGDAFGRGMELALACDIRLAADTARFALPQVADGRIPADGGTQRLPRIVGRGKALEMLLVAEEITVAEAVEIGLVSSVFPADTLPVELDTLAETVAAKGPIALRYIKEAVNKGMDMTLAQGLCLEADLYFLLHTTTDRTEGINAFKEKRTPDFKGE